MMAHETEGLEEREHELADAREENAALRSGEPEAVRYMRMQRDVFCEKLNDYIDRVKVAEKETARLQARVNELEEQASMACQEPRDDCSCAGCRYADEANREVKP